MQRHAVLAAVLVVALAAAGCGGNSLSGDPVATNEVTMVKSYRFDPDVIKVAAGDTVTWTNHDNFSHSVRIEGGEPLVMKPGESVTHTFDAPGTFRFDCSFHPQNMKGTVVVGG